MIGFVGIPIRTQIAVMSSYIIAFGCGNQVVHQYYKPLSDLEEYVERERLKRKNVE